MNQKAIQTAPIGTFVQESERVFKLAEFLSQSDIIPKHFQGRKANCFLALEMSQRLGINFFELVNGLYVVHGTPAFSGAFTISRINASGLFQSGLNFSTEGEGPTLKVTAYAKKHDGSMCSATVSMEMAKQEGWTKNIKYKTMPEHMLTYRAATFFCRRYCPEILMGARTADEVEDIIASKRPDKQVVEMIEAEKPTEEDIKKLENLMVTAAEVEIPQSAIDAVYKKLNLDDKASVLRGINFLETMINDKVNS